eukprot:sb/3477782/
MPFLICCVLHTAEIMDMSPWYQIFSLNILPLNAILNPVLYSDLFTTVWNFIKKHQIVIFAPEGAPEVAIEIVPVSESVPAQETTLQSVPAPEATPEATFQNPINY